MHLRVIVPTELTSQVLDSLRADKGSTNVILLDGAALEPVGDVLLVDVAREEADAVLDTLRQLGVEARGSIAVEEVDFSFSKAADRAERAAPGLGADAVVWQTIEQRTGNDIEISLSYLMLMAVATMIAGVGVIIDQPILIVGAMVVGPDFGPLAALSVGIVRRHGRVVLRSVAALAAGYGAGIAVTVASTLILNALGFVSYKAFVEVHQNLDFIWTPNGLSWVIALLAGAAGILSLTSTKSGSLVGVAISVTTVPAAASIATALAYNVPSEALGALAQLASNLVAIVVGGVVTLGIQRGWRRLKRPNAPK